jgi:hypothetical protein
MYGRSTAAPHVRTVTNACRKPVFPFPPHQSLTGAISPAASYNIMLKKLLLPPLTPDFSQVQSFLHS